MDEVSMTVSFVGGEAGGVSRPRAGTGPGEHTGMCLLGTGTGAPRDEAFKRRCGGGVDERPGMCGALATTAAIVDDDSWYVEMQLKARNVG